MIHEEHFDIWDEAEARIKNILSTFPESVSGIWFRGHADANWRLETTLERRGRQNLPFADYYRITGQIKPAIETFTNSCWEFPTGKEILDWSSNYDGHWSSRTLLAPEYLTHLRHHGFPSPLLDWSSSPYIAAYFAFSKVEIDRNAAIYLYCERPTNMKTGSSNSPQIQSLAPYLKTHRRHFLQKSRYTICGKFERDIGWRFAPHEDVFTAPNPIFDTQDLLWKITIPGTERPKVLKQLDQFNINAFSLFDSEDLLMEMLAVQEIDEIRSLPLA